MSRNLQQRNQNRDALTLARDGIGALSRAFQERPLLFVGLGLAAVATYVARRNSLMPSPRRIRAMAADMTQPRRRSPAKKTRSRSRSRKPRQETNTPTAAA